MLVTGCSSGLGRETMRVLAMRGVHVLATARTPEKARAAAAGFEDRMTPLACELADPASVRACVAEVLATGRTLDAIICNAGIMALPTLQTACGYELQFFTNHMGHFMLVTGLLGALGERGRVVVLSSAMHHTTPPGGIDFDNLKGEKGYAPWRAYGASKLANLLFAKQLARRFAGTSKTANAIHPGVIRTNLSRSTSAVTRFALGVANPLFMKSEGEGAATQVYVATHPSLAAVSGEYFADCNLSKASAHARDEALAERLWQTSEGIAASL